MTVDLHGLSRQLEAMATYLVDSRPAREARAERAAAAFAEVCRSWQSVRTAIEASQLGYLAALPEEDPAIAYPPPPCPATFSVAATDGSQIEPERHAMADYFVLNTGWVVIHYGENPRAELGNAVDIRFRSEDLWFDVEGRRVPVRDELLGTLRTVLERRKLADLLQEMPSTRPVVGLVDGSLLDWSLEIRRHDLPASVERDLIDQFDRIRASGHLLAGYVSRPGSRDVANLARVPLCSDRPGMDCRRCSSRELTGVHACEPVDGLVDGELFRQLLPPYYRSALFRPRQRVQERYGEHRMLCFYLNAGSEIGRVEVPAWIAVDPEKLALTHALLADQCRRGRYQGRLPSYPPVLTEAHEQAVLDGGDRLIFEQMLERRLLRAGLPADISAKRMSKQLKAV